MTHPSQSTPAPDLISGLTADELAPGSVVRWWRDRTALGHRTKGADGHWTPVLSLTAKPQYVVVRDAGAGA